MKLRLWCFGQGLICSMLSGMAGATEAAWLEPDTGIEFVRMVKGCFAMGLPKGAFDVDDIPIFSDRLRRTEMPEHEVCVDEFWIARHEVREGQWQKLMAASSKPLGEQYPVTGVSWPDAMEFARRLSSQSSSGNEFRLPTEAEWEYACRAGLPAQTRVLGTDELAPRAWFSYSYDLNGIERYKTVHPVGGRQANAAGLYDMLGNAWEWTLDHFEADAYRRHPQQNPRVAGDSAERVMRGGSFQTAPHFVRCEARGWLVAEERRDSVGFRLVVIRKGEK